MYTPIEDIDSNIYDTLSDPPSLNKLFCTISLMPNYKASGPLIISYEILKYLGHIASSLLLILLQLYFNTANIPDL